MIHIGELAIKNLYPTRSLATFSEIGHHYFGWQVHLSVLSHLQVFSQEQVLEQQEQVALELIIDIEKCLKWGYCRRKKREVDSSYRKRGEFFSYLYS